MKFKLFSITALCSVLLILFAFVKDKSGNNEFEAEKKIVVMRKIAHEILRYTGDSTSRIPPVEQLSENEFKIPFESSFTFKPDSLVSIIDKIIADNELPGDYVVNVREQGTNQLVYAYLGSQKENIVPCGSRRQPDTRYCMYIRFKENKSYTSTLYLSGISLLGIGLLLFGLHRYKRRRDRNFLPEKEEINTHNNSIRVGKFIFYPEEQLLFFNEEKTILTVKESKLLSIFAATPNQTIDRNRLQKEVWEDEGVIVGRSLDMFISKLRKKLAGDPNVKLTNIHGKGYKLEISE